MGLHLFTKAFWFKKKKKVNLKSAPSRCTKAKCSGKNDDTSRCWILQPSGKITGESSVLKYAQNTDKLLQMDNLVS